MCVVHTKQGNFQQFWEKPPGQNWEKMIDFKSKLGEIHEIEHNKGRIKIFSIVLCQAYRLSPVFKYHSDMGHCFS